MQSKKPHKSLLLIIDNLGSGGAQNQLTILAAELVNVGYDVTVFTFYKQDFYKQRLDDNGVKQLHIQKRGKIGFNVIINLSNIIAKNNYNVVISFLDTPNIYNVIVKTFFRLKVKTIISYRSMTDLSDIGAIKLYLKKWINQRANHIISNSNHERLRWIKLQPKIEHKWSTIYNAVDFTKIEKAKKVFLKKGFLVVGSISPAKNGLVIIEALEILKNKGYIIPLTWIGQKINYIPERKKYLKKMEALISKYKLQEQWTWEKPTPNIFNRYMEYKALILASTIEGLPNVVCEAMSCGTLCIISDTLDHPQLIKDNETGFLFDPLDPISLSDKLIQVLNLNKDELNKMNRACSLYATSTFSKKRMVSKFIEAIEK